VRIDETALPRHQTLDFAGARLARHLVVPLVCAAFPVEAEAAGAESDDVEKSAGHYQVLVEMDHVVLISGR